jgi:hypothetical protein
LSALPSHDCVAREAGEAVSVHGVVGQTERGNSQTFAAPAKWRGVHSRRTDDTLAGSLVVAVAGMAGRALPLCGVEDEAFCRVGLAQVILIRIGQALAGNCLFGAPSIPQGIAWIAAGAQSSQVIVGVATDINIQAGVIVDVLPICAGDNPLLACLVDQLIGVISAGEARSGIDIVVPA